jgi:hypothetical protein
VVDSPSSLVLELFVPDEVDELFELDPLPLLLLLLLPLRLPLEELEELPDDDDVVPNCCHTDELNDPDMLFNLYPHQVQCQVVSKHSTEVGGRRWQLT